MLTAEGTQLGSVLIALLLLALPLQVGVANGRGLGLLKRAQEVTKNVHTQGQVGPACSPDGHWLAFEYHEAAEPHYPRVGIMDLSRDDHPWRPLLEGRRGSHLYVGDFSWSPDSRWLAAVTNYPNGSEGVWSDSDMQILKINIYTEEKVRLTSFPPNTSFLPSTAWLRSGVVVFVGEDGNIYGVSDKGGELRKLISAPTDNCGGVTNTFAVSPDEQSIAFEVDADGDNQVAECDALWIGDLRTGYLRRAPTNGLRPLNPFWLDADTILFSGVEVNADKWLPTGIYMLLLSSGKMATLMKGLYLSPFVCDSGKALYFSWGPTLQSTSFGDEKKVIVNGFSGFHIWKTPLHDVVPYRRVAKK